MAVGVGDSSHHPDIGIRSVVAHDRRTQVAREAEVSRPGAEIDGGCRSGVDHVLRVAGSVTIGIDAHDPPRAGDELHRAHGPIEDGVPVQEAAVSVGDSGGLVRTIKRDADDARLGNASRVELVATEAGVITLDFSNGTQQRPVDMACRVG